MRLMVVGAICEKCETREGVCDDGGDVVACNNGVEAVGGWGREERHRRGKGETALVRCGVVGEREVPS